MILIVIVIFIIFIIIIVILHSMGVKEVFVFTEDVYLMEATQVITQVMTQMSLHLTLLHLSCCMAGWVYVNTMSSILIRVSLCQVLASERGHYQ